MSFELTVYRFELGLLTADWLPSAAVAALEEGLDTESLRVLASLALSDYAPDDVLTAYRRAMAELALDVSSRDRMISALLRAHLVHIVTPGIDPFIAAQTLISEIYYQCSYCERDTHVVGDSLGIERLYGLVDSCEELTQSVHPWDPARSNAEQLSELRTRIRTEAERLLKGWLPVQIDRP